MLGSWLRPKQAQPDDETGTDDWDEEKHIHKPKYRSLVTDPDAPHNAILAEIHVQGAEAEHRTPPSPKPETLLDPVTGQLLGILSPPETEDEVAMSSVAAENEELWSHLSTVLDLQAQIAKKHLAMEGQRGGADRKKRQSGKPAATSWDEKRRMFNATNDPTGPKMTEVLSSTTDNDDPSMKVEGDEDVEARSREEEFLSLAEHLEGRKEAIDDIMGQLDRLSVALTKFHALQVPKSDMPGLRQTSNPLSVKSLSKDSAAGDSASPTASTVASKAPAEKRQLHPLVLKDMVPQVAPVDSPASLAASEQ